MNGGSGRSEVNAVSVFFEGVWILGEHVSFKKITDGLSKTYLVGEKGMDADKYLTGDDFADRAPIAAGRYLPGATNAYVRYAAAEPHQDRAGNCLACHDFGSAHVGTWNVVLADGSVRSLSYEMNLRIHKAFGSIDGKETPKPGDN